MLAWKDLLLLMPRLSNNGSKTHCASQLQRKAVPKKCLRADGAAMDTLLLIKPGT